MARTRPSTDSRPSWCVAAAAAAAAAPDAAAERADVPSPPPGRARDARQVVKVHDEEEVAKVLPKAVEHEVPVTFRAAGTSLSGQAVTDSVLLKLSHTGTNFRDFKIEDGGKVITVEPGLIAGEVNRLLEAYQKKHNLPIKYKIGPDPSSIDSCMMGGVVANNSSGMCCGVKQNTYHTLRDMRIVFADGTVLDTADAQSRAAFMESHAHLVRGVQELAHKVRADEELTALIKKKFAIKCTTGYSINALVDHDPEDPIEIIKRLMIGSEGTLGFVSRMTYNTVPDYHHKASAFVLFPDIRSACTAAAVLRRETEVDAVEMFDWASLVQSKRIGKFVEAVPRMAEMPEGSSALLIECRGQDRAAMEESIASVTAAINGSELPYEEYSFTEDPAVYNVYWDARKGLIPMVGGEREAGTSFLIEDVACEVDRLGDMTCDLIDMFKRHGYHDASLFGHALEGNLHLVFAQGFRNEAEVQRFSDMMTEMCEIVAEKHHGSLKAEHGTGRNVAPFVEMEWGRKATDIMWELKELFDPDYVLNPGVILNNDPDIHRKSLKLSPPSSAIVDRCIECGFCEKNCPSRDVTLTPRQRITVFREINRLRALESPTDEEVAKLDDFERMYVYNAEQTCAADGMCQEACPVKINTGELMKSLRKEKFDQPSFGQAAAAFVANHFEGVVNNSVPALLNTVAAAHRVLGTGAMGTVGGAVHSVGNAWIPLWNQYMPTGAAALEEAPRAAVDGAARKKVVYLPTCVTRTMGPAVGDEAAGGDAVHKRMNSLLRKAGYEVVYPEGLGSLCCGMLFNSRGYNEAAGEKSSQLERAIAAASEGGKIPVLVDTSPCVITMKDSIEDPLLKTAIFEPLEFIDKFLVRELDFEKTKKSVAVHVPCSAKKMGKNATFVKLAGMCAEEVHESGVPCCGMAGDRGMRFPELTAGSLNHLTDAAKGCTDGYSTSRTCEMSLSNHSGMHWRSLVYLVDESTSAKTAAATASRATA